MEGTPGGSVALLVGKGGRWKDLCPNNTDPFLSYQEGLETYFIKLVFHGLIYSFRKPLQCIINVYLHYM